MSAAKRRTKKRKRPASRAMGPLAVLLGPGRPVLIIGILAVALYAAWHFVWQRVRDDVLVSDDYVVTAQKVKITPQPGWIHADVRSEVFRSPNLDGTLSSLDRDLAERIGDAFSLHPWVASVAGVRILPQGRVTVELVYRRPACMVEVRDGLFPVDARGVLLPVDDFSPIEASRYPKLVGVDSAPLGTTGESWGDARVVGGAEIAELLLRVWDEWELAQIVPSATGRGEYSFTLHTRRNTRVRWGLPPGSKDVGEMPAEEKLARLQAYVDETGTLEGRNGPQELDIRNLESQPPRVSSRPNE